LGGVSFGADGVDGGSGTVALITVGAGADPLTDDTKVHDTDLELYRSWRWEPSVEGSFSYQSVTVRPGTEVVAGDGDVMVSAGTFTMDAASWDTTVSSSNGTTASGSVSLEVTTLGLTDSTLVADSSSHDWSIAVSSSSHISGGSISGRNVTFTGTGDLAFENSMQLTAEKTELAGNSLSQDATTVFSTDGGGYASNLGFEFGAGGASNSAAGGGGGHGGDGGAGGGAIAGSGGLSNDIELFPVAPGSGGGSGRNALGGSGGGVIHFAIGGDCLLDGTLSANGAAGVDHINGGAGGGGAGGTIRLACDTLAGAGVLRADGGGGGEDSLNNGSLNNQGNGSGGGGGRIAVHFDDSTFSNQAGISVAGGLGGGSFGADGTDGAVGTIFFESLPSTSWVVSGTAQGGQITFEILGISLQVTTTAGQSAEQVAAAIAAAILAEPGLAGIEATVTGPTIIVPAPMTVPFSSDPGVQIELVSAVPALSPPAATLLGLGLLVAGFSALSRRGRRRG
ncbi:MAG: hypothetical protein AAEJ52_04265, partial [Myxococcota bacterium]